MKKSFVVVLLVIALAVGFIAGFTAYDHAEKYVETHGSMNTIITMFAGHEFTYDVEKTSYEFETIRYTLLSQK